MINCFPVTTACGPYIPNVCEREYVEMNTYTDEERDELMFGFALAFVIGGYLILEYSLSFVLFLYKDKKQRIQK